MKTTRNEPSPRHRIFILDDHPITRYGLVQLLDHQPDLVVCGEADNVLEGLAAIKSARPDLVLADLTMPGKSGLDFIKELRAVDPLLPVLVMSMHDESIYAERVLRAGGRGYIMKNEGGEKLLEAIRHVLQGQVYVSKKMSAAILNAFAGHAGMGGTGPSVLSDREFEVFQCLGEGLSTREISQRLNLSVKTIGTHRQHIKEKLKLRSGPELMKEAVRWAATQQLV
jgi:DNA-binding NarL/FixJ family response regulator